jgi:hypothetical protein
MLKKASMAPVARAIGDSSFEKPAPALFSGPVNAPATDFPAVAKLFDNDTATADAEAAAAFNGARFNPNVAVMVFAMNFAPLC